MQTRLILTLLLVALTAIFVAQNTEPVEVHLFVWSVAMSRALMFLAVLGVGMLIGWGLHSYVAYRHRHRKEGHHRRDTDSH